MTLPTARPASPDLHLASLATETPNPRTEDLDALSTLDVLRLMNEEDRTVAPAVGRALPSIARAVEVIVAARDRGGRLVYVGAGTSGRLGLLDAVECPPTFGTGPDEVLGLIAGGRGAFGVAVEGAEDDTALAVADLEAVGLGPADVVVGLAASGRTPYVIAALQHARAVGAGTVSVSCNLDAPVSVVADVSIEVDTGPEVITGSTRLKAGTAQKMVCNMLSSAAMVRTGKVYGNLMVDVRPTNAKLVDRARRIVETAAHVGQQPAADALQAAGGHAKTAIVMLLGGYSSAEAHARLEEHGGRVREAVAPAP